MPPALSARGIVKRFGNTVALDDASLDVRTGTLHALLGENGAGKTSLMRIVFGLIRADAGDVRIGGIPARFRSSADAIAAGLGMVHQHFSLIPAMSVAENVALGEHGAWCTFDPRIAAERVRQLGAQTGLVLDPEACVADLPVGAQQRVEILKALARDVRLLILDEPTAVLTPSETQELYSWLRHFVSRGRTVVLITHKLRESLVVADSLTVLRRGKTVLAAPVAELNERDVVSALVGEGLPSAYRADELIDAQARGNGLVIANLQNVSAVDANGVPRLRNATLTIRSGEILGIAGVEGAGQQELLRVLAGRQEPSSGTVELPARIGFVPEDRLRDAIISPMTLVENFALKEAGSRHGKVPWTELRNRAALAVRDHDVRAPNVETLAAALSGGNQQKFVLGRELEGSPDLLVVQNPVRGLDIQATEHVLRRLRRARAAGVAVVMYSSDPEELLAVADRILVCFAGRLTEVPVDSECIARALVGVGQ